MRAAEPAASGEVLPWAPEGARGGLRRRLLRGWGMGGRFLTAASKRGRERFSALLATGPQRVRKRTAERTG